MRHACTAAAAALVLSIVLATPGALASDWPNWRGPNRDGIVAPDGFDPTLRGGQPPKLWEREVGNGYASAIVAEGKLFVAGWSRGQDTLFCLDARTGEERWTFSYQAEKYDSMNAGGPSATAAYDDGHVYHMARDGRLMCFDAADGTRKWTVDVTEVFGAKVPQWGFSGSPVIDGDRVLIDVGTIVALNKKNGRTMWRSKAYGEAYSTPVRASIGGREVVVALPAAGLVVLDAANGREIALHEWRTSYDVNAATPIVSGDRIFLSTGYNTGGAVLRFTGRALELVWEGRQMRNQMPTCVLIDGHLYGFDDRVLKCIEFATGREKWDRRGLGQGTVIAAGGTLIVQSENGDVITAPASPEGFEEIARFSAVRERRVWVTPTLANGLLYSRGSLGALACFDVSSDATHARPERGGAEPVPADRDAARPVGWRHDGTGRFPDATPPTDWSDRSTVVWSADLGGWSNASPVVLGDRIFVCVEPDELVCVDRADGAVMWRRPTRIIDTVPESERAAVEARLASADGLMAERSSVERELNRLRREARRGGGNAARARLGELTARLDEIDAALGPVARFTPPRAQETNGFTSATPVSDGRHVFAMFGSGAAAAFTVDGERVWSTYVDRPELGWGHSASPALAGDTVVVLVNDLHGLDARTGVERWRVPSRASYGTPIAFELGGRSLIATPGGEVVDPADGRVLARGLGELEFNAPAFVDGVLYMIGADSTASRLAFDEAGGLAVETLWSANVSGTRHYASPTIVDGLIYIVSREAVMSVLDAANGSLVYERELPFDGRGANRAYASLTLAGGLLFAAGENGDVLVLRPGRTFDAVGTCSVGDPVRANPVFIGAEAYVRLGDRLMCVTGRRG